MCENDPYFLYILECLIFQVNEERRNSLCKIVHAHSSHEA